jgi:ankyrin repeat protein
MTLLLSFILFLMSFYNVQGCQSRYDSLKKQGIGVLLDHNQCTINSVNDIPSFMQLALPLKQLSTDYCAMVTQCCTNILYDLGRKFTATSRQKIAHVLYLKDYIRLNGQLLQAINADDDEKVTTLLAQRADPNYSAFFVDSKHTTALEIGVINTATTSIIDRLLKNGANPNLPNGYGRTPFEIMTYREKNFLTYAMVNVLLDYDANAYFTSMYDKRGIPYDYFALVLHKKNKRMYLKLQRTHAKKFLYSLFELIKKHTLTQYTESLHGIFCMHGGFTTLQDACLNTLLHRIVKYIKHVDICSYGCKQRRGALTVLEACMDDAKKHKMINVRNNKGQTALLLLAKYYYKCNKKIAYKDILEAFWLAYSSTFMSSGADPLVPEFMTGKTTLDYAQIDSLYAV